MTDKRLSSYDRDGLRKQAEKRRADKLDASADLLAACEALMTVVKERTSQLQGWYPKAWVAAQEALYKGETAIKACRHD